ncbi:NifB/NifX family molybdenum-iron cluster-binding protein [Desulfocurvibacter africanus]|uniref:NifB/NifX family molybdenum-iron cluster-binding protein n=1 Tax=Desulfocurvibacter africanus TaxID=873 RepID=UPI0004089D91|nr:NifB/NifX family molybdenum-iron cluster-binding protein [Desulfocurvibacter africanus]
MIKIAVPSRGGMVDEHFGHCEAFTIFSIDDGKAITDEEKLTPPPGCGCKSNIIPVLVQMGVTILVAGNMGEGAVVRLQQSGIQVVRGASGPVRNAVQAYLDGKLQDRQEVCLEHGHHGCHGE